MRGGKRKNAGRKPGSSGIKKTKLKATEALKVTKGIRFMPEQIQRIEEAVRLSDAKNFSQFVVNASIKKADAILFEKAISYSCNCFQVLTSKIIILTINLFVFCLTKNR